jgi:hypothetical protein
MSLTDPLTDPLTRRESTLINNYVRNRTGSFSRPRYAYRNSRIRENRPINRRIGTQTEPLFDIFYNGIENAAINRSPVTIRPSLSQIRRATKIALLRDISYNIENESPICPIDREVINEDDSVMQIIECGHFFREANLRTHFTMRTRCPLCRFDIRDYISDYTSNRSTSNASTSASASASNASASNASNASASNASASNASTSTSTSASASASTSASASNASASNASTSNASTSRSASTSNASTIPFTETDVENPFDSRPSSNINPIPEMSAELINSINNILNDIDSSNNAIHFEYSIDIASNTDQS